MDVSTVPLAAALTTQQWHGAPTMLDVGVSTQSLAAAQTTTRQLLGRTTVAALATLTATDAAQMVSALLRVQAQRVSYSSLLQ